MSLFSELEELEDILDTLIFEDEPSIFTEDYAIDLVETALHIMDDYMEQHPNSISDPDFYENLIDDVEDIFYTQLEDQILTLYNGDDIEDDMNDILEYAFKIYVSTFQPERSASLDDILEEDKSEIDEVDMDIIEQKINGLRDIPQPTQRTEEWYKFRHNLITASNAYKAFENQSTINQLIYEKCKPLQSQLGEDEGIKMVNTNSPLHWGQKYEPLSVKIYEQKYNTQVEDFGCIQHTQYKFLGASPDGINIDKSSDRYGRMLEIKNIVNREINGIPKKEYWVQMQLQMEVCDLDECDFLETKFTEYPDYNSYVEDSREGEGEQCLTKDGKQKGSIIYFHARDGRPFYVYKPLELIEAEDINKWEDDMLTKYQSAPYNYTYLRFIYWKLDILSCVIVLRNKEWFKNNIGQLEKVWKTIEDERVTGYEHRAPVRKNTREPKKPYVSHSTESTGCLLTFTKIIKIE
jgi:hypothetical protein